MNELKIIDDDELTLMMIYAIRENDFKNAEKYFDEIFKRISFDACMEELKQKRGS